MADTDTKTPWLRRHPLVWVVLVAAGLLTNLTLVGAIHW